MSTAQDLVLATPELLEAILSHLPPHALLFAQLISRSFHTAVTTSPTLQRLLFLRAAPLDAPHTWTLNPLLRDLFTPFFVFGLSAYGTVQQDHSSIRLMKCFATKGSNDVFLSKDATWRSMLVLQPPPKVLKVTQFVHAQARDIAWDATLDCGESLAGGVTMGVVYDIAESYTRGISASIFGLSVSDSDTGPQITLYLRSTQSCVMGPYSPSNKQSEGAEVAFRDLDLRPREGREVPRRLNMSWATDLGAERGGIDEGEFREWLEGRKKAMGWSEPKMRAF